MKRLALAVLVLLCATAAQAKWKVQYADADPKIVKWFSDQHNAQGQWCCDNSDGHEFDGDYTFNTDGSVTLKLEGGKTRTLPKYMVLTGPNPTGHAVWWFVEGPNEYTSEHFHSDYCFAPGAAG